MKLQRCLAATGLLLASSTLYADVVCSLDGNPVLDFGTVDPFAGGNIQTQVTLNWSCSRGWFESQQNTLCLYVNTDDSGGMLPRRMTATSGQPPRLPFNVYDSAARVNVVGQPGNAVTNGVEVNVSMPIFSFNASGTVTLYGLLPTPLPANTRAELHQALKTGSQVRVRTNGQNQSCDNGGGNITDTYALMSRANIADQCQVSATDLDFGTRNTPLTQVDSTSTITVRCSNSTDFQVGLNDGLNGERQMTNGSYLVNYELYQDAAHTTRWGNVDGERRSGTGQGPGSGLIFTVFGRVFADPNATPGSYADTVTVEVSF